MSKIRRLIGDKEVDATRARILDGAHLWLTTATIEAAELVAVTKRREEILLATLRPGPWTDVVALAPLAGDGPAEFQLALRRGGTRTPLRVAALPESPAQEVRSLGGPTVFRLQGHGSKLSVRREVPDPHVLVTRVGRDDSGLLVSWRQEQAPDHLLVDAGKGARHQLPVTPAGNDWSVVVPADLPLPIGVPADLLSATGGTTLPLLRAHDTMRRPTASVLMPYVNTPGGDRLALRWTRDGRLQAEAREAQ